jgi:predicted membrane protein (TIGR00267 family)
MLFILALTWLHSPTTLYHPVTAVTAESKQEEKSSVNESGDDQEGKGIVDNVRDALELTKGAQIARRYLAMNAFDGALTMLGLLLGGLVTIEAANWSVGFEAILLAAAGTSIAMAISGFSGSYLTERAERDREMDEIEKSMLCDMSDTMYARASKTTTIVVAVIDGASPAVTALIIVSPLFLVPFGILYYTTAFMLAIVVCMVLLFLLGLFLGHVSRKNMWIYGAKTLAAGIVTALLVLLISIITRA